MKMTQTLLALRTGRAYDKNLPFLGAFQSSFGAVMIVAQKCGC
jgi:hypothetical protein